MKRCIDANILRKCREDANNKIIIACGFGGGKVIYKGHDLRIEKGHIRVTDMHSGYSWTEDTLKDAKHEVDTIAAIRIALKEGGEENEKSV